MPKLQMGTRVLLSVAGHNGFYYPGEKEYPLLYDVDTSERPWLGGGETKRAGIVPENSLFISGRPDVNVTVWFNRKDMIRDI